MMMERTSKPRSLRSPTRSDLPQIREGNERQVWDPVIGAYRAPRIPLSLSKSSLTPASPEGRPHTPSTPNGQQSTSSTQTSTSSSLGSVRSSTTSLSLNGRNLGKQPAFPQRIFRNLPPAIYLCILRQLRLIHIGANSVSCQTCYLRDLCALSLVSRTWDKAVVRIMYAQIHIVGSEPKDSGKKKKSKIGTRLKLLRRTLRGRVFLSQLVRELKVPSLFTDGEVIPREMIDLVASVVMACPNLERLDGFYPIYSHEYDRLTHALSTRRRLKEHIWLIGENASISERSLRQLPPGLMDQMQKAMFLHHHNAWQMLTTLFLYSPEQGILEKDIFVNTKNTNDSRRIRGPGILHRLPLLQHLCIANFDLDDFDDFTLLRLPPLFSLRLQELEGVTFWGLSEYSRTRSAFYIRSLSLVNLDITYMTAISNLLLHMKNLKRFTLVQDTSPELAAGEAVIQPVIASIPLEYLHWDITVPGSANSNLASSIRAGGFPRLRTLRTPSDHDGQLQALCKPRACVELPSDWSGKAILLNNGMVPRGGLREARRRAQERIENAWGTVKYKVVVEDEAGVVREIFDLGGFMGTVGSKIDYCLDPDVPGSDQALIDFSDVVGRKDQVIPRTATAGGASRNASSGGPSSGRRKGSDGEGEEAQGGNSCKGVWNSKHPRGPSWWQHTERPRYQPIDLQKFF